MAADPRATGKAIDFFVYVLRLKSETANARAHGVLSISSAVAFQDRKPDSIIARKYAGATLPSPEVGTPSPVWTKEEPSPTL